MADDWERLARAIRDARANLGMTQKDLAAAAGVAHNTIKNLESGRAYNTRPRRLPDVANALGWTPASASTVLDGGDPTQVAPPAAAPTPRITPPPGMSERVQEAIESGAVVDAQVLEMPGEQPGMRMVTLLMRDPGTDVDPEAVRVTLAKWDRLQRDARQLTVDSGGDASP